MRRLLGGVVDVREGEGTSLTRTFLALFSLIAAHTILETARDALFLGKLPASRLTFVYVLLAALALVVSPLTARLTAAFGRRNALVCTLVVSAYGTTIFYFLPRTPAVLFALYVWSGLFGAIVVVQFWLLAGQLFTVAQGKRLFGPLAAGGVLGAVFGATAAATALEVVAVQALLLVVAFIIVAAALVLTTIRVDQPALIRDAPELPNSERPVSTPDTAKTRGSKSAVPPVTSDRYVIRMMVLVVLSTAAVLVVDYLFKSVAAESLPKASLGRFFARYYAVVNAASFMTQVFMTGPVVRRLGVVASLTILPVFLFAGAAGTIIGGSVFIVVLLTKGADGAMRHSLHRVASELLWMPLSPATRERAKSLLDTVVGRVTSALTAGAVLVLATRKLATPRTLGAIVAVLTLGWIATVVSMRGLYLDVFRKAVSKGLRGQRPIEDLDIHGAEAVMDALSSRDAGQVVAAMDLLAEQGHLRLIPGLILYHEAPEVLVRALEIIPFSGRQEWLPIAERLLSPHHPESVRVAGVRAMARHGQIDVVRKALDDPSPAVHAHAIFALAHHDRASDPGADPLIATILSEAGDRAAKIALLDAIRDHGTSLATWSDAILTLLDNDDAEVVEHAASAVGSNPIDDRIIPALIARLAKSKGRASVTEALVALGDPALSALEKALSAVDTEYRIRLHAPRALSEFHSQRTGEFLLAQLGREKHGLVRYKVLRALGRLAKRHPLKLSRSRIETELDKNLHEHLHLLSLVVPLEHDADVASGDGSAELIVGLLRDKMRQALERAFRLIQLANPSENIRGLYDDLQSRDPRVRANAQEFLDNLVIVGSREKEAERIRQECRDQLRILCDDLSDQERLERARQFLAGEVRTADQALRLLMEEKEDSTLKALAMHYVAIRAGAKVAGSVQPEIPHARN